MRQDNERGSMLVVALGILTLLSVLAITFVSLMRLERQASKNYVDTVRARLIAEGGLETGMALMKRLAGTESYSDPNSPHIYADGNYALPLEESLAARPGDPNYDPSRRASFAGGLEILGQTYTNGEDRYKIKVIDAQTQFNLNSVYDVVNDVDHGYVRFLDALGVAISRRVATGTSGTGRNPILHARFPKGDPNAKRGGEAIYAFRLSREGQRFNSKTELTEVLATEEDYILLRDYVTTKSWFDPHTVSAKSQTLLGPSGNRQTMKAWSDVVDTGKRSPINVNLATKEVLAANLAGIGGRGIFLYTGDYATRDQRLQDIDAGTMFADATSGMKEETEYGTVPVLVYFAPFGFQPGTAPADPPKIHGSLQLADMIHQQVRNRPFQNFQEWEEWVDRNVTDGLITSMRDPDGVYQFPRPDDAALPIFRLNHDLLTASPSPADVRNHPRFRPWFFNAVRSLLKANFNPNARLSSWNPDDALYMEIDKGGLLFPSNPTNPGAGTDMPRYQTSEWCFASKGIFEIVALGEVLGAPPEDPTQGTEKIMYAQAKVRGILQLYDTVTHTTQREFERWGAKYENDRIALDSFPTAKAYWDPRALPISPAQLQTVLDEAGSPSYNHPSEYDGYLEVATRIKDNAFDSRVLDMGPPTMEILFDQRKLTNPTAGDPFHKDALIADTSGTAPVNQAGYGLSLKGRNNIPNGWCWPFGSATTGVSDLVRTGTEPEVWRFDVLTPQGYLNSELRRTELWYRASDKTSQALDPNPDGRFRGDSYLRISEGGNVAPTPRGGCEFWYKPEFDWAIRDSQGTVTGGGSQPDARYCGLLSVSHVTQNPAGLQATNQPGSWTRGTQMFMVRNTSGDLRITRMFYEVVGPTNDPQEEPLLADPVTGNPITFSQYFQNAAQNIQYVWPPQELLSVVGTPFENIQVARTELWVPFQQLRDWRAREWHHIAFTWDDEEADDQQRIKVWLDGSRVQAGVLVHRQWPGAAADANRRYEPFFPDPTDPTRMPLNLADYMAAAGNPPPGLPGGALPADGKLPSFVRLNTRTGPSNPPSGSGMSQPQYEAELRPKDQIVIGGVSRNQAVAGGLFKHEQDAILPANGTIDEVRFFGGTQLQPNDDQAARYEEEGEWIQEIDLSTAFPVNIDEITLGGLTFTGYLPTHYAGQVLNSGQRGAIELTAEIRRNGAGAETYTGWNATFDLGPNSSNAFQFLDDSGVPVKLRRGDTLVYKVKISPARSAQGVPVASPVLDDVNAVYFLPNSRILLKERVNQ
ncbi:MAG: pilus assembly PilX N-terminal domain-containing protein [Planctomycetota bacterium]